MAQNLDFLFAAVGMLILVWAHFAGQRKLNDDFNKLYKIYFAVGVLDILLDGLGSVLCAPGREELAWLAKIVLTLFYMVQAVIPFMLYDYTQALKKLDHLDEEDNIKSSVVLSVFMFIVIALNYIYGFLFYFDAEGVYHKGICYFSMYVYAIVVAIVVAIDSIYAYRRSLSKKYIVIWECLGVLFLSVLTQAFSENTLTIGYGIGLGLLIMFLTINNPGERMDTLTGVFENQYFCRWITREIDHKREFHVIAVSLKRLQLINAVYGNAIGNQVLLETAQALVDIKGSYHVFRVKGNRFVLLCNTKQEYRQMIEKVAAYFRAPILIGEERIDNPVLVTGVLDAHLFESGEDIQDYIERLNADMSISGERDVIEKDEASMAGYLYCKEVERYLQTAIDQPELFEVFYQPIYSIREKRFVSIEALSRLKHPSLGYLNPELFFEIAEKNGMVSKIGRIQFDHLCRFLEENEEIMRMVKNVKFNLSPAELLNQDSVMAMLDRLTRSKIEHSFFQFEITETVASQFSRELKSLFEQLRERGVGVCLDDFGSGYANLDTIFKLPFTTVKLDRTLLFGVTEDEKRAQFYKSMIEVFQKMGYHVIAEGIETEAEMKLIMEWGVDLVQGYFYSRPVSGNEILNVIKTKIWTDA